MAGEQTTYKKLIIVQADTTGLQKLEQDTNKAQGVLNQFGAGIGQVSEVTKKGTTVSSNFGKITSKAMYDVKTASGETYKVMIKDGAQAASSIGDLERAMRRVLIVVPIWFVMRQAFMAVIKTITDNIKFLIEFETAMARIKIVGKGTAEEYVFLQDTLINLAHAYGVSAKEMADAAVVFAQQGRTVREIVELTRTATLASKILGTDIKTVVENMTAAVEGFKLSVSESTDIVDKWVNVSKNFAVTSKDLADATKRAGATANQLGITFSEFLGHVTSIVEVTRKSGAEAARGLSFIYARLLTSGKQTVEQLAKIPFYLDATGQATNVVGTQMRGISSILTELAGKWKDLTTQERLEIATALGSKRQMVVLYGLMQNYNAALDARIVALTSAGSSEKAFQIIQDTTAYKIKKVGTAWNVFTNAVADTSAFRESLSIIDKWIIGWAAVVDFKKGFAALQVIEVNRMQLANETRLSEIKSLQELLTLRKELSQIEQTPENADRLTKVSEAIDVILSKTPQVKVAVELGDENKITKEIESLIFSLSEMKIRLSVALEIGPEIAGLEEEIRKLKKTRGFSIIGKLTISKDEIIEKEKELQALYQKKDKLIEEQLKVQQGLEAAEKLKLEALKLQNELSADLTEKEKEKLDIQGDLNNAKALGLSSSVQLLEYEIELVKNSKFLYIEHEKNLKLYELEKKRLSEINVLMGKYAKGFKSTFQTGLKDLLSGTGDIGDLSKAMTDKFKDSMAEALSKGFSNKFNDAFASLGGMFGGIETKMGSASQQGSTLYYNAILNASKQGAQFFSGGGAGDANTKSIGDNLSKLASLGGGSALGKSGAGRTFGDQGQIGSYTGYRTTSTPTPAKQTYLQAHPVMTGLAVASFAKSMAQSSQYQGGDVMGGATNLGMQGAMAGMMVGGPVGAIIGGAIGALTGAIQGGKVKTTTETTQNLISVPSKIDVTNKQLEMLNRNFVGFKNALTYILQKSAYFSEKSGTVEDEFAINALRD